MVAEVEGAADIRVRRLVVAVDVGEVINPDGVANQIEGGAIQATSWTLKEAVRFDRHAHHQRHLGDLSDPALLRSAGGRRRDRLAGPRRRRSAPASAAHGPTAAAIGNAVFAALGVRVRDLPITRERIIAAMA